MISPTPPPNPPRVPADLVIRGQPLASGGHGFPGRHSPDFFRGGSSGSRFWSGSATELAREDGRRGESPTSMAAISGGATFRLVGEMAAAWRLLNGLGQRKWAKNLRRSGCRPRGDGGGLGDSMITCGVGRRRISSAPLTGFLVGGSSDRRF